jgi:hypothetical protein
MPGVAAPARRSLERVSLLARGLALLLGAIAAGQTYAAGGGAAAATGIGFGVCAAVYAVSLLLLRRYRRYVEAVESEPEPRPPRRRPPREPGRRRLMTGEPGPGKAAGEEETRH